MDDILFEDMDIKEMQEIYCEDVNIKDIDFSKVNFDIVNDEIFKQDIQRLKSNLESYKALYKMLNCGFYIQYIEELKEIVREAENEFNALNLEKCRALKGKE